MNNIPTIVGCLPEGVWSMAEFCLKCWNKLNGTNDPPSKYILSRDLEICEECGQLVHIVLKKRRFPPFICFSLFLRRRKNEKGG